MCTKKTRAATLLSLRDISPIEEFPYAGEPLQIAGNGAFLTIHHTILIQSGTEVFFKQICPYNFLTTNHLTTDH